MAKNAVLRNSTILVPVFVPAVIVAILLIIVFFLGKSLLASVFLRVMHFVIAIRV